MRLFRGTRFRARRTFLVALLAYVIAATGLLGALNRSHAGMVGPDPMVLCTLDGMTTGERGDKPLDQAPHQHCLLCNVTAALAAPDAGLVGADVALPVAPRAPIRTYAVLLPDAAFTGWIGTRPPRAPPFAA